jgi:hypothetical protein
MLPHDTSSSDTASRCEAWRASISPVTKHDTSKATITGVPLSSGRKDGAMVQQNKTEAPQFNMGCS